MWLIQSVPLSHFIVACAGVATICLLAARNLYEAAYAGVCKDGSRTGLFVKISVLTTTAMLAMILFMTGCGWLNTAFDHGLEPDRKDTPIGTVLKYTALSPVETMLPSDLTELHGKIVIYFRFGCPDCVATHEDMMQALSGVPSQDIYFVSTRSEQGKKLRDIYPCPGTPSGMYICNDPAGEQITHILFVKNELDESVFDESAMTHLLDLYQRQA